MAMLVARGRRQLGAKPMSVDLQRAWKPFQCCAAALIYSSVNEWKPRWSKLKTS